MDQARRHQLLLEIFVGARETRQDERSAYLDRACGDDAELRRDVERLLAHDQDPIRPLDVALGQGDEPPALRAGLEALYEGRGDPKRVELPRTVGKYRILRTLGVGGMGTVYEAEQDQPRRTVALKVLRTSLLTVNAQRRFEQEGEFLGRLQHPGIAQVFESGTAETTQGPQPYLAMELIRGAPLTEHATAAALSLHDRVELVARIADAVQHAHEHGVIHRDLKPANIVVDALGQPKVLDFGIARATDSDLRITQLTDLGQVLGTLAYMSPEQASGSSVAIDARSDVYSLGVVLFELLSGRLPYDVSSKALAGAVRAIQEQEPHRMARLDPSLRGDIETIVRKALEKSKERRYESATALASDLRHFLHNEPITARPASRLYTLEQLLRRNRAVVGAASIALLALFIASGVWLRSRYVVAAQRRVEERERYDSDVARTLESLMQDRLRAARESHDHAPVHLRNWEWRLLDQRWMQELAEVTATDVTLAEFIDDARILTVDSAGQVRVWDVLADPSFDARDPHPMAPGWGQGATPLALRRDGRALLAFADGALMLGDPLGSDPPTVLTTPSRALKLDPRTSAVAPSGALVAVVSAEDEVIVLDSEGGERVLPTDDPTSKVLSVAFVADSDKLVVRRESGRRIWDLADLTLLKRWDPSSAAAFTGHEASSFVERIGEHGKGAGLHFDDSVARTRTHLLDRREYEMLTFAPCGGAELSVDATLLALDFGRLTCFVALSHTAQDTARETPPMARFLGAVKHAAGVLLTMSPSSSSVMIHDRAAGTIRLMCTPSTALSRRLAGHTSYVYSLAFSPDGATIVSGSWDGSLRFWDALSGEPFATIPLRGRASGAHSNVLAVAYSPDGLQIARMTGGGLELLDLASGREIALPDSGAGSAVAYSPNGRMLVGDFRGRARIWDARTLQELVPPGGPEHPLPVFAFDPSSTLLATGSSGTDHVQLSEVASGAVIAAFEGKGVKTFYGGANALAFSPGGDRLLVGWGNSNLSLHDVPALASSALTFDQDPGGEVFAVAFSPDGTRIASGARDGVLRVWDVAKGTLLLRLAGHEDYIKALAFSPDGTQIATCSGDKTVRIWDSGSLATRWREREANRRALQAGELLVARLYGELGDADAVITRVREDTNLDARQRRMALRNVLQREVTAANEAYAESRR